MVRTRGDSNGIDICLSCGRVFDDRKTAYACFRCKSVSFCMNCVHQYHRHCGEDVFNIHDEIEDFADEAMTWASKVHHPRMAFIWSRRECFCDAIQDISSCVSNAHIDRIFAEIVETKYLIPARAILRAYDELILSKEGLIVYTTGLPRQHTSLAGNRLDVAVFQRVKHSLTILSAEFDQLWQKINTDRVALLNIIELSKLMQSMN